MTMTENMVKHRIALNTSRVNEITAIEPKFSLFGKTVYLRTYARKVNNNGKERRETWREIIERVTRYSFDLHIGDNEAEIEQEAHELFSTMYHLKGFPAGRTLWIGGTSYVDPSNPEGTALASMNCAFTSIDKPEDFYDIVYLLMNGTGVGFSCTQENVDNLNKSIYMSRDMQRPEIEIRPYNYNELIEYDTVDDNYYTFYDGVLTLDIGDSREGWAMFMRDFIASFLSSDIITTYDSCIDDVAGQRHKRKIHLNNRGSAHSNAITKIIINADRVRPKGTQLKTFGGTASGPQPLFDLVNDLVNLVREENITEWKDTLISDIVTMQGRATVAGGTRRSALISCGDSTSEDFLSMKTGEWYKTHPWRNQANNSQYYYSKPSKEELLKRLNHALVGDPVNGVYPAGEPGMFNMESAQKRRKDVQGFNPCGEIALRSGGMCNLCEINMAAHLFKNNDGKVFGYDKQGLFRTAYLLARHNLRITNVDFAREMPRWDKVQKEDRLCGVALSGMVDFKDAMNWDDNKMGQLLEELRDYVTDVVNSYADEMGINIPLLITTIKPSGSISLLPGISPGAHPPIAPYFWRRIRIGKNDGVARALAWMGVPYEAEMHEVRNSAKSRGLDVSKLTATDQDAIDIADTLVFSFPAKSNAKKAANDYTAIEQLEFYKMTMQKWTQHNTSITIYVEPQEVEGVADWMLENWSDYVGISFLPKDGGVYEQAPYEAISKEAYELALSSFPDLSNLEEYLSGIESEGVSFSDIQEMCESGNCPTR